MRTIIAISFLLFVSASVAAQPAYFTITGRVTDVATQAPLQGASVFAQNTTMGTATDADGNFKLYLTNGGYDLVITFTGYETVSKRITTGDVENKNILIPMKKKESVMEDVVIKASNELKDGWERYGNFFVQSFIGITDNSKQCNIKNPEVLKFYFSKKKNRLKVLATEPVEIENTALGYKLKYTLDSFTHEYNTQTSTYTGYPLFEEMQPQDSTQVTTWQVNRLKAYRGSILHFMRSVYNKNLKEEGFEIQFVAKNEHADTALKLTDFYGALNYEKDDSTMIADIIPNQQNMAVLYSKEKPDIGYLALNDDAPSGYQLSIVTIAPEQSISIEQNGYYFDQNDITITGYWSWKKIADMVPYDYHPPAE